MRILSYQGWDTLEVLAREGVYRPIPDLSRERRDYSEDIAQLDGAYPVWGFQAKEASEYLHGELFHTYKCEMSLDKTIDVNPFVVYDLIVPQAFVGKTHNAYKYAMVFPEIRINQVQALYQLIYSDEHSYIGYEWYYPEVKVLTVLGNNPLFKESFKCFMEVD